MKSETKTDDLLAVARELSSKLVEIRRKIHENPELAYNESATSALAEGVLSELGYKVFKKVAGTGLVAEIGEGE